MKDIDKSTAQDELDRHAAGTVDSTTANFAPKHDQGQQENSMNKQQDIDNEGVFGDLHAEGAAPASADGEGPDLFASDRLNDGLPRPKPAVAVPVVLESADKFDIKSMRLTPGYARAAATTREQTVVPVDKPSKHSFFRVHPTQYIDMALLKYEVDGFFYAVSPRLIGSLAPNLVKPCTLYLWIDRDGTYGLVTAGLPLDDATDYTAWQSMHTLCRIAMSTWVRHAWNKSSGGYDVIKFCGENDPGEPTWPNLPIETIVEKAFMGRLITSLDHVVLRRLRGEI